MSAKVCPECGSVEREIVLNVKLDHMLYRACHSEWHDEPAPNQGAPVSETPRTNTEMPKVIGYWMDDGFVGEFSAPSSGCIPEHGWRPLILLGDCAIMVAGLKRELAESEARAAELQKACQEMNSALSRCAYLSGPPNDQEVSWYDVEPYPQSAVDEVKKMADKLAAETARADGAHNAAIDKCHDAYMAYTYRSNMAQADAINAILALKVPQ